MKNELQTRILSVIIQSNLATTFKCNEISAVIQPLRMRL